MKLRKVPKVMYEFSPYTVEYLVYDRKIGSVYDRNAVYSFFFHFAMTHFLKIDVNVFVVDCHFFLINTYVHGTLNVSNNAYFKYNMFRIPM